MLKKNVQDILHNLKVCFAFQPIKSEILRDCLENLNTVVTGFANDEAMNMLFEGAADPSLAERVFEEQNRAEALLEDANKCTSGNQVNIDRFREKHQVAVYSAESQVKKASHFKEIQEAINMIRNDGLKTWMEFKDTGTKPTPRPINLLIPGAKIDVK